jgi:hypothetical protein
MNFKKRAKKSKSLKVYTKNTKMNLFNYKLKSKRECQSQRNNQLSKIKQLVSLRKNQSHKFKNKMINKIKALILAEMR